MSMHEKKKSKERVRPGPARTWPDLPGPARTWPDLAGPGPDSALVLLRRRGVALARTEAAGAIAAANQRRPWQAAPFSRRPISALSVRVRRRTPFDTGCVAGVDGATAIPNRPATHPKKRSAPLLPPLLPPLLSVWMLFLFGVGAVAAFTSGQLMDNSVGIPSVESRKFICGE